MKGKYTKIWGIIQQKDQLFIGNLSWIKKLNLTCLKAISSPTLVLDLATFALQQDYFQFQLIIRIIIKKIHTGHYCFYLYSC